ncbi:hypothetical protein C1646_770397 [Rhizophagus diaphanus]|nr:hypothetical protein C1646_770397 [Rhizophagus diaphanus] [Rhizophagus sp. MUCL 43196]
MSVSDTATNPSELEVLRRRNTELEAELEIGREKWRISASSFMEEIDKLKKKNADLFTENFDLKREVAKLREELGNRIEKQERKNVELEDRLAKVEQSPANEPKSQEEAEDEEMNAFLIEQHKKSVGEEIRQTARRNREKKLVAKATQLQSESTVVETPSVSQNTVSETSHEQSSLNAEHKKGIDKLKQELFNPLSETRNLTSIKQNHVTKIEQFLMAIDAEDTAMKANQEEILCWTLYAQDFRVQLDEIIKNCKGRFGEKKARSLLYDSIADQLSILRKKRSQELGLQLRDISRDSLRKKTQRAEKLYNLFGKVGMDKIKYIKSYSANSISELTNEQIQEIIEYSSQNVSSENNVIEISETPRPEKILTDNDSPADPQGLERTEEVVRAEESVHDIDFELDDEIIDDKSDDIRIFDGSSEKEQNEKSENSSESDSDYDEQIHDELTRKEIVKLEALEASRTAPPIKIFDDIDFRLDDEILDDKPEDINIFDDIDFDLDEEIMDDKPVDLNHPINARTEGVLVHA